MLSIENYVRPATLEEAYRLTQEQSSTILDGVLWLQMQDRSVETAIDLCDLGLDRITLDGDGWHIGAMVSLSDLENHQGLNAQTQGALREAVTHIARIRFGSCATLASTLFGRFGHSDVLTLLEVLEARVVLYHAGTLSIQAFARLPKGTRDILMEVVIPEKPMAVRYLSQCSTYIPFLACAVSRIDGRYTCAVGASPSPGVAYGDERGLLKDGLTEEAAQAFGEDIAYRAGFGSRRHYRRDHPKTICSGLVRQTVLALREAR